MCNLIHLVGGGVNVKPGTKDALLAALKGQGETQGVIAVQPYVELKSASSVFHNTYLMQACTSDVTKAHEPVMRCSVAISCALTMTPRSSAHVTWHL